MLTEIMYWVISIVLLYLFYKWISTDPLLICDDCRRDFYLSELRHPQDDKAIMVCKSCLDKWHNGVEANESVSNG
jgi:hypothetical protein